MSRRLTTAQDLLDCLPPELPWGYAVGALPGAPADSVVWLKPARLGHALFVHMAALERANPDRLPSLAQRQRMLLADSLYRNPAQWRCGEGDPTGDPEAFVRLFGSEDAVARLGDPTMDGTPAGGFLVALMEVSGWPNVPLTQPEAAPADSFEAWDTAVSADLGRWVPGLLPDPEAELYIRPFDEGTRDLAQSMANCADKGFAASVPFRSTPYLVADVVRSGPGGDPLLTPDIARNLWLGLAQAIANLAWSMVPLGGWGIVPRFRGADPVAAPAGVAGPAALVAGGEGGDAAVPPDGRAPVAGDGLDGELHPVPGQGQRRAKTRTRRGAPASG